MTVGRICCREVDLVGPDEDVRTAARRMLERNVGTLIAVDAGRRPIGILTDRDLALKTLTRDEGPDGIRVDVVVTGCRPSRRTRRSRAPSP